MTPPHLTAIEQAVDAALESVTKDAKSRKVEDILDHGIEVGHLLAIKAILRQVREGR